MLFFCTPTKASALINRLRWCFAAFRTLPLAGILLLGTAACAFTQARDELTFGIGATVTPEQSVKQSAASVSTNNVSFDPSFAFTADYYHRLAGSGGTNRGAFEFGGGVDLRTPFVTPFLLRIPLGLRLEVRDYYSGKPNYNVPTNGSLQHNVLFAAGMILRFR